MVSIFNEGETAPVSVDTLETFDTTIFHESYASNIRMNCGIYEGSLDLDQARSFLFNRLFKDTQPELVEKKENTTSEKDVANQEELDRISREIYRANIRNLMKQLEKQKNASSGCMLFFLLIPMFTFLLTKLIA